MHEIIACAGCGMDPSTDAFIINAAIAGLVSGPWMLRAELVRIAGRIRRAVSRDPSSAPSCPMPAADDEDSPLP